LFIFFRKTLITEKTIKLEKKNQYIFDVNPLLNKKQIKNIFEKLYKTKIQSIKIQRNPPKKKFSYRKKKAIVKFLT